MNITIIENHFETRASTLLSIYTALSEKSRGSQYIFKINNDPFDMIYIIMGGKLFGTCTLKIGNAFELASIEHPETLIRSIEEHYTGYELFNGKHMSISDMMAEKLFKDEYFIYGLETFAESNNQDIFEYIGSGIEVATLEEIQSSNADVLGNIEKMYQLATGINETAQELVEGLRLVTEFVQDEKATQEDFKALERKLSDLEESYYIISK